MATSKDINHLVINKLPDQEVYEKMVTKGLINDDELYLVEGSQSIADIEGLSEALDGKADASHTHDDRYYTETETNNKISSHNTSSSAHDDIRDLIADITTKLNNFLDVDDISTDQLSEVLTLINNNKSALDSLASSKVNVSDIVDNLTTSSTTKVLSAKQGVAIKALIDALQTSVDGKADSSHGTHVTFSATEPVMDGAASVGSANTVARSDHQHPIDTSRASASDLTSHTGNTSNPHSVTKSQVGLGSVVNTGDSATPVSGGTTKFTTGGAYTELNKKVNKTTTVNGKALSSNITLSASDVGALPDNTEIPDALADLTSDSTHRTVTDTEKATWNAKSDFSGSYNDLTDKPTIPSIAGLATESYVDQKVADIVDSSPEALNTLNELAAALGDDPNFATTVATEIGKKVDQTTTVNGHALSGNVTVTKSDVGLGSVPNVTTNNQTPTFTETSNLENIVSGEKVSTLFGKIKKAITDLIAHLANTSNPHSVTKSQVGLGNVENKSSATIRGELTKANVTTALGYTPPETVPSKTSELTNDSGFITSSDIPEGAAASTTSPKMDGTATVGTETAFARGDHIHPKDTTKANLASPTFTGTPKAPTATAGTNTTQIATTAFVKTAIDNIDIPDDTDTTYDLAASTSSTNGNVKLNLTAGGSGSGTDSVTIKGSGATTVTTDANGVITISSTDNNSDTNYYHTPSSTSGIKIATGTGVADMYVPTGTTSSTVAVGNHTHSSYANQNAFSKVAVSGQTTVEADTTTDTLTLVAGNNVTITTDATNDKVTIAATDTTYSEATTSANGLMTSAMVTKLNGIATGATANTGTITGVSANGTSVATSGVANIPAASTSAYGVTKLSSSTSSTSTALAATPSAVKAAYDLANSKASLASPAFTGTPTTAAGTDYTTKKLRNVMFGTSEPTSSTTWSNGDIFIVYAP